MNANHLRTSVPVANDVAIVSAVSCTSTNVLERVNMLTWHFIDDVISDEDMDQLNRDLESSVEARQAYLETLQMHINLTNFFEND